jgi:hypothetical protein
VGGPLAPYPQPLGDGNKYDLHLAADIPLIKDNFCTLSFIDVPKETYSAAG